MTTVDRRAVEALVRDLKPDWSQADIHDVVGKLPSSNAQAVAWQCRYKGSEKWEGCTETEYNNRLSPVMMRVEYRALCVCSGDAKEADK